MKTIQEIIARLAEIQADIESRGETITAEELANYEIEVNSLREQRTALENAAQTRRTLLESIAAGRQGVVIDNGQRGSQIQQQNAEDPLATMEYRQAFFEYVRTGNMTQILRDNAVTTTGDISAAVPTTILNEVIRKMSVYGQIFSRVRKTSVPGGVSVPILTLKPTANWITEEQTSDRQKVQSNSAVTFSYHGLEVKVAQSLIATIVGIAAFENVISDLIYEAMISKLEKGIISGDGTGKPLGVTADTHIPAENVVTMTADEVGDWEAWKKKVFAKMPLAYKAKASFIMAAGTWEGYIDGMTDANGQPIGRVNYGISDGIQERFGSKEVIQVEDDVVKPYDDCAAGEIFGIMMNLGDYCVNSNMQLSMYRYKDEDTNQIIDKAILIADGKVLDPNGVIIIKKA